MVGQIQHIFLDPGDGREYKAPNWTRLTYAGNGLFSLEEDVYNPAEFVPAVTGWLEAYAKHHPDAPTPTPPPSTVPKAKPLTVPTSPSATPQVRPLPMSP